MVDLDGALSALSGFEFDWLMVDSGGALAVCQTAGFGEVPDALLALGVERVERYRDELDGLLDALPEIGGAREEAGGVGRDEGSRGYGRRGLTVYSWEHWRGPYRRLVVPERTLTKDRAPELLGALHGAVITAELRFARTRRFQLADLMACRRA